MSEVSRTRQSGGNTPRPSSDRGRKLSVTVEISAFVPGRKVAITEQGKGVGVLGPLIGGHALPAEHSMRALPTQFPSVSATTPIGRATTNSDRSLLVEDHREGVTLELGRIPRRTTRAVQRNEFRSAPR